MDYLVNWRRPIPNQDPLDGSARIGADGRRPASARGVHPARQGRRGGTDRDEPERHGIAADAENGIRRGQEGVGLG